LRRLAKAKTDFGSALRVLVASLAMISLPCDDCG
jgi:hypothetical protein